MEALDTLIAEMIENGILFEEACSEFERRFIQRALERAQGKRSLAAQMLGIHRNTLGRRMQELNLDAPKPPRVRGASA
jgi:DNA-binding NtrC family response regulator